MPFEDIKNAGTLSEIARWGWPYHGPVTRVGLNSYGLIGTTGVTHPAPFSRDMTAWLIEMGRPPIVLTPAEQAFATANNLQWYNYALIPGGHVYGTPLDLETYIHVDAVNDCWMVTLSYSLVSTNTVRITATIKRFGKFIPSAQTPPAAIVKTYDVNCEMIDPVTLSGGLAGQPGYSASAYSHNTMKLEDVYTNGSKALVAVFVHDGLNNKDIVSCIDVVLTGAGGANGAGLTLTATETKGQSTLTHWVYAPPVVDSFFARYAFYKSDGTLTAVRLGSVSRQDVSQSRQILENNTVIDHITLTVNGAVTNLTGALAAAAGNPVFAGSTIFSNGTAHASRFRSTGPYDMWCCDELQDNTGPTGHYFGIHRMRGKGCAWFYWDGGSTKVYGPASTPIGTITQANPVDVELGFAFDRKTHDYTFSLDVIACYV